MKKLLILLTLLAVLVAVAAIARYAMEPRYEGMRLNHWIEALRNKDDASHQSAPGALAKIGSPAVPALVEALRDEHKDVRSSAAYALGRIGPDAKAAVPALVEALKDEDEGVREAAKALKTIQREE